MAREQDGPVGWGSWDSTHTAVTAVQYRRNGPWSGSVTVHRPGHAHVHHGRISEMKRLAQSLVVEHRLLPAGADRWEAAEDTIDLTRPASVPTWPEFGAHASGEAPRSPGWPAMPPVGPTV